MEWTWEDFRHIGKHMCSCSSEISILSSSSTALAWEAHKAHALSFARKLNSSGERSLHTSD
eukprot:5014665-Amphidinium_carterae.1